LNFMNYALMARYAGRILNLIFLSALCELTTHLM